MTQKEMLGIGAVCWTDDLSNERLGEHDYRPLYIFKDANKNNADEKNK